MVGSITSQGDRAMKSDLARQNFHLDGRGITIGVISDSFNSFQEEDIDIATGDLPGGENPNRLRRSVRVLQDLRIGEGSDEGRAMLQIIHDIAPRSKLLFHTVGDSETTMAAAIRSLARAGADLIVDDIGFFTAPYFQDGIAAQAVTEVSQQGVIYFSAAGNDANRSYESEFRNGGSFTFRGTLYEAHDFDPGETVDLFQDIQFPSLGNLGMILNWDQPINQVTTDYELFLLRRPEFADSGDNFFEQGFIPISDYGLSAPQKAITHRAFSTETNYLVIARKANSTNPASNPASERIKWIDFFGSSLTFEYVNDRPDAIAGSTVYGHPNAREAIAVGAAFYRNTPVFGTNPPILENFSSRGGTAILFDNQGNRLPTPETRRKPELVAPDGVSTSVTGFEQFFGTSAAAPHLTAVAALMLQRAGGRGNLTRQQLLTILQQAAVPVQPNNEFLTGTGLIQADQAVLKSAFAELTGGSGDDLLRGSNASENFVGLDGNDRITGGGGFDALLGGLGDDWLEGRAGNDYLLGDAGEDTLNGGRDDDTLMGKLGSDRLTGGDGDDFLRGFLGNDVLDGGRGTNTLQGDEGRDRFILNRQGMASIENFADGQDVLELAEISFERLEFSQQAQDTVVQLGDHAIARLIQFDVQNLSRSDFG